MTMGLKFSDEILWGQLVKSWATGKNYVDSSTRIFPVPRNRDDLLAQCQSIGLTVTFGPDQVGISILQHSREVVGIKLPPKDLVEATEASLKLAQAAYPLPQFYEAFFGKKLPTLSQDDLLRLHAARIGDYSIQHCG
jgi:hypothetical protein